jgi:hypothetical protein
MSGVDLVTNNDAILALLNPEQKGKQKHNAQWI